MCQKLGAVETMSIDGSRQYLRPKADCRHKARWRWKRVDRISMRWFGAEPVAAARLLFSQRRPPSHGGGGLPRQPLAHPAPPGAARLPTRRTRPRLASPRPPPSPAPLNPSGHAHARLPRPPPLAPASTERTERPARSLSTQPCSVTAHYCS